MSKGGDYWRVVQAVCLKDLASEWHNREIITAMLTFAVLILFIFHFALNTDAGQNRETASGVLWVALLFSGTIGLGRSMAGEKDRGCLDGLLLAPVDRSAIYFGKALSNWFFMLLTAAFLVPIQTFLNKTDLFHPGLLAVILLGTAGYALTGTLLAALAVQTRARDTLLPILLFPVTLPLILAAIQAGGDFLKAAGWVEVQPWITLLIVYDIIFAVMGWMFFDSLMEE